MAETEANESFRRFQAAKAMAGVETDLAYDPSLAMFIPTSGTATDVEQSELETAVVEYLEQTPTEKDTIWVRPSRLYHAEAISEDQDIGLSVSIGAAALLRQGIRIVFDATASHEVEIVGRSYWSSETSDFSFVPDIFAAPAGDITSATEIGAAESSTDELQAVVAFARDHGLEEVAGRLVELGESLLGDDEEPLDAASARLFVDYCIARKKQARPLMTVTPTGELDATWKGRERERIIMRFFSGGSVWVAYKLPKERGSFEAAVSDLLDPDLRFNIPSWA